MATATLSVAGTTCKHIADGNSANDGVFDAGWYYAVPPFGNPPSEGDPEYDWLSLTFPGVDGIGSKNLGFRGRNIDLELIYLGADPAAVETAKNTLLATMHSARFSVTLPGGTARPSCRLKIAGFSHLGWVPAFGGKFGIMMRFGIRQLALT